MGSLVGLGKRVSWPAAGFLPVHMRVRVCAGLPGGAEGGFPMLRVSAVANILATHLGLVNGTSLHIACLLVGSRAVARFVRDMGAQMGWDRQTDGRTHLRVGPGMWQRNCRRRNGAAQDISGYPLPVRTTCQARRRHYSQTASSFALALWLACSAREEEARCENGSRRCRGDVAAPSTSLSVCIPWCAEARDGLDTSRAL